MAFGSMRCRLQVLLVHGLHTDGAHHKQWFLEQIGLAFGLSLDDEADEGIAP